MFVVGSITESIKMVVTSSHNTHVEFLTTCNAYRVAWILLHLIFRLEVCPSILATVYAVDFPFNFNFYGCFARLRFPADWIIMHLRELVSKIDKAAIVVWLNGLYRDCAVVEEFACIYLTLVFKQSIGAGLKVECRCHWEEQAGCKEIEMHLCLVWFLFYLAWS